MLASVFVRAYVTGLLIFHKSTVTPVHWSEARTLPVIWYGKQINEHQVTLSFFGDDDATVPYTELPVQCNPIQQHYIKFYLCEAYNVQILLTACQRGVD